MAEPYKHIYKVDLNQTLKRFDVGDILASGDDKANIFEVAVCRGGANVDMTGCAVYGYFIRPNDETMKINGTAEGSLVRVELPKSCYVYDGAFALAIKVTGNGITQTVAVFDGRIVRTTTDNIVDGDRVIYGLEDLLAQITATENAAKNANEAANKANTAAGNADTAAEEANKWMNAEANATAISANSQPTVDVSEADGKKVLSFGIPAGKTPNITFKVATGEPGTQVLIQQSGTPENPIIDLTIPRGDTGSVDGIDYFAGSPSALGEASPGTANGVARGDHVHPLPTAENIGALPAGGTAVNADKLGGNLPEYYAPAADVGMDLLWSNASTTSAFPAQTIPIDLTDYRAVIIVFRQSESASQRIGVFCEVGYYGVANFPVHKFRYRRFTVSESNVIEFNGAREYATYNASESSAADEANVIPVKIYGIK